MKHNSQESPRGEKLDEMPDYETPNGVVAFGIPVFPPTVINSLPILTAY
jgi:hypothetical protein